ncbi:family 16 glycosylhydrolase [Pseudomonas promysalinigenes]|uniref:glycoside hydrolase family 16 protein n=1 Tax=Pseudomonas promysalinigenes TaxID=485898 RepID=UPI00391704C6
MGKKCLAVMLFLMPVFAMASSEAEKPFINVDFSGGGKLDQSQWTHTTGVNTNTSVFYTDGGQNLSYKDGALVLEARKQTIDNPTYMARSGSPLADIKSRDISSSSFSTNEYFQYGKVEVVARLPDSKGVQPAIWLQGKNKGQYGEIDIVEANGRKQGVRFATVHSGMSPTDLQRKSARKHLDDGYHKYVAEWNEKEIIISYDDQEVLRVPSGFGSTNGIEPLRQPMHLKISLGAGSKWSGPVDESKLPQTMQVRSIKVWKHSQ